MQVEIYRSRGGLSSWSMCRVRKVVLSGVKGSKTRRGGWERCCQGRIGQCRERSYARDLLGRGVAKATEKTVRRKKAIVKMAVGMDG